MPPNEPNSLNSQQIHNLNPNKLHFIQHQHNENICQPVIPKKAHPSDIGYDLTLVRKVKQINDKTVMFDSSISILPPENHYIEIVPRSSLSKFGYVMTNSIGIIDPTYRGTLKVVLTKVVDSADDIQLPFTRFQLILRKQHDTDVEIHYLNNDQMMEFSESTTRGTGGFGSTD